MTRRTATRRTSAGRAARAAAVAFTWLGLALAAAVAHADVDGGAGTAHGAAGALDAGEGDPAVAALRRTSASVGALVRGELPPDVPPASLFDVTLDDERSIRLEVARLEVLVRSDDAGAPPRRGAKASADAAAAPDDALWRASLELDAARLAFLRLPQDQRARTLDEHEARRRAAVPPAVARAETLEADQREALEAAERARTEAERLVAREEARLLGVLAAQDAFQQDLASSEDDLLGRKEEVAGWVQRAREARATPRSAAADRAYDSLRRTLRDARDALTTTLADAERRTSRAPHAGDDPLADLRVEIDRRRVDALRDEVRARHETLAAREAKLVDARRTGLYDAIGVLNAERLALLDSLTDDKRDAITGFGSDGRDQAAAELRQLSLIVRSHRRAATMWIEGWRSADRRVLDTLGRSAFVLVGWLVVLGVFAAWRRQAGALFSEQLAQLVERDRRARRLAPGFAQRALAFVVRVRGPLEWLVLVLALGYLLPAGVRAVLEVRILGLVAGWISGTAFVVAALDALAAGSAPVASVEHHRASSSASLRFRSLRLVGHVTVAFVLLLELTALLVGRGTIHGWVASTCWLASVPIFLVLVRWWRDQVFARIAASKRRSTLDGWILANRHGWKSFFAASIGAVRVFVVGGWRAGRARLGRLTLTRRALAYLFQRRLEKRSADAPARARGPLPPEAFAALGPDVPSAERVPVPEEDEVAALVARAVGRKGGVVAIVGERGAGKSTTAAHLARSAPRTVLARVDGATRAALAPILAAAGGLPSDGSIEGIAAAIDASEEHVAVVLDDAHAFAPPIMGALAELDELLRVLGRHARTTTWVLCIDRVVWPFLVRARGARPLFDDVVQLGPWSEEGVSSLVRARSAQAGLAPRFDDLVDPLPLGGDGDERAEALAESETSFYRLLWDQTGGNPGAAIHAWRRALATSGDEVRVAPPDPLDLADLDALPDAAVFVLRAVLQLAPATRERIAEATLLTAAAVDDALRYARGRHYVELADDGYRVTWTWFRTLTRFLQRRHLLSSR